MTAAADRGDRLVELLVERELDCLLVTDLVNVRYLSGFTGTNGACLVTPAQRLFLTDFRYTEQAAEQVRGFELLPAGRDLAGDLAVRLAGRAGFDDAHLSVRTHAKLAEKVSEGVELVAAGGLVERLRQVKGEGELAAIAAAAELATAALERVVERGLAGRTERAVALELEAEMRSAGAEEPSFPSIVAAAAHGALPHAVPRDVEIPRGTLVVIDWGARLDGYCSDCTRTVATGDLSEAAQEAYELVRHAQEEALGAVRAGAGCRAVDAVARDLLEEAGHGEHFGHGLGHGVGLEVHEEPRLTKQAEGE
ncbi:MAG: Xaa-Pro peptidase family protein, partial [Actinomycetota bacterium]|nr:Xaa-Pro peptidase family protein [Actinomycetota bacterium]